MFLFVAAVMTLSLLIIPILVIAHNNGPFWIGRATWQNNPKDSASFLNP